MKKLQICLMILMAVSGFMATAQAPFSPGNVVVVRVGDGTPVNLANTVAMFLDEYTPAGTLVQSIALPATDNGSNHRISQYYDRSDLSFLTLSPNKEFLTLVGFMASPGTSTTNITTADRTIARVDFNGSINSSTSILGSDINSAAAPISAVTDDGTRFWVVHESSLGGIRYSLLGQSASTVIIPSGSRLSTLNIYDSQLYCTFRAKASTISGGLPTTGPQTITNLDGFPNGFGTSSQHFFADLNPAIPGFDVIYITENADYALSKFSFDPVANSWVSNGTIGTDASLYRGITGVINGTSVTLYATRGTSDVGTEPGELVTLTDNSGYNGTFSGTPTVIKTAGLNTSFRGVAMAPQALPVKVSLKAFLQGAYSTTAGRHKDVTSSWATILNANATSQPYNTTAFGNYNGGESVSNTFFTSNTANDVVDWVLVELRDKNNPANLIARKAGFIREDGTIVGTDGNTLTISGAADDSYYIVIRHRNHLSVRSANPVALNSSTATLYDFTTAQNKAFQNPSVPGNTAMATKDLLGATPGIFMLWGGNANGDNLVRASAGSNVNDYLTLMSPANLNGNTSTILTNVYRSVDMNLDGLVRASAGANVNDYLVLMSPGILNGNTSNIITSH